MYVSMLMMIRLAKDLPRAAVSKQVPVSGLKSVYKLLVSDSELRAEVAANNADPTANIIGQLQRKFRWCVPPIVRARSTRVRVGGFWFRFYFCL